MTSVDDRIVNMQFNNANFESKLADTIKSLDKLRASLDFANSKRGLDELSTAGKNFNMTPMGHAVDGISNKFLALATVGVTVLATVTSKALESAARITKAFSVAPVISGFQEYETQLNSVQTILANTAAAGVTMDDVNVALQKLNEYSDKTIYNFGQMARNIGTFTAAGVELDTSVNAIKGIANLAALSGSNAEQASGAMYQLSQAIATGTVRLIDWNSVTTAGIGGEVFKNALFETGKAMGALGDVPMAQTFVEWEEANGSFRSSLEKDWLSAEVLTATLATFTGDLTDADLAAQGFSQTQIDAFQKVARTAVSAATEVKTFTQLLGTVKEAIGTGWADTFKIIIGNFTEAKELWTEVNNGIGKFVSRSADARNELVQGWKDLGGRDLAIQTLRDALAAIGAVLKPLKEAFRDIFPKKTAQDWFNITESIHRFVQALIPASTTIGGLRVIFRGFFAAIEIGWTVIKEIFSLIADAIGLLSPAGSSLFEFSATTGNAIYRLNQALVEGGGIHDFFVRIREAIGTAVDFIKDFKDNIVDLFEGFGGTEVIEEGLGRVGSRFESLSNFADNLGDAWGRLMDRLSGVFEVLGRVWDYIRNWFSELGANLAEAFKPGDFDAAVDVVNVGLLGGIAAILTKFLTGGLKIDFGGGLMKRISQSFNELTGVLKAMQADIRANTLLKIAAAIAIIAASLVVLSMIDSVALTKALTAMAIGFGQLMGVMVVMNTLVASPRAAFKLAILGAALITFSVAALILAAAIKILSDLDWDGLAKGLVGVAVGIGILVVGTHLIAAGSAGMIVAGIAMGAIAAALLILSLAVKAFATMSWGEMVKGLIGVAVGLGIIAGAMHLMPVSMILTGPALIAVATGLSILAGVVKLFSMMSWGDIGKGLIAIGGGLLIIAGAMQLMPLSLPITAAGLLILSFALTIMAGAVKLMASIDLGDLAKSIGAFAAMLLILVVAMNTMQGSLLGAAALVIVSGALLIMAKVLKELAQLSIAQIVTGLITIAGAFAVLGLAAYALTPVLPALFALGAALILMGTGFALFGAGAALLAKAFEIIAKIGVKGVAILLGAIEGLIVALPRLIGALIKTVTGMAGELIAGVELLARLLTVLLSQLLDTVIELTPKIAEAFGEIISAGLALIREKVPEFVATGFEILTAFLSGIRDNIGEIVNTVVDIVTNFLDALSLRVPELIDSAYNFIVSVILGAIAKLIDVHLWLIPKGIALIGGFLSGVVQKAGEVITWFAGLPAQIPGWIGDLAGTIKDKGIQVIGGFFRGLIDAIIEVILWFGGLPGRIVAWIGDLGNLLYDAGKALIGGLVRGIVGAVGSAVKAIGGVVSDIKGAVTSGFGLLSPSKVFRGYGINLVQGLILGFNDMRRSAKNATSLLGDQISDSFNPDLAVNNMSSFISRILDKLGLLDNFNPVITPVLDLTKVEEGAGFIERYMRLSPITPDVSFDQARLISTTADLDKTSGDTPVYTGPAEVTFEQNIYAPTALSTNDIYRNTKSQIVLAKEELGIP